MNFKVYVLLLFFNYFVAIFLKYFIQQKSRELKETLLGPLVNSYCFLCLLIPLPDKLFSQYFVKLYLQNSTYSNIKTNIKIKNYI